MMITEGIQREGEKTEGKEQGGMGRTQPALDMSIQWEGRVWELTGEELEFL